MRKRGKAVPMGAALLAAGLGYAIGLLTAPKSGKETRRDIKRNARRAALATEKHLKVVYADLSHLARDVKRDVKSAKQSVAERAQTALEQANETKKRVREVLSAFHEGESDDLELQQAVREAEAAIAHLRTFLTRKP